MIEDEPAEAIAEAAPLQIDEDHSQLRPVPVSDGGRTSFRCLVCAFRKHGWAPKAKHKMRGWASGKLWQLWCSLLNVLESAQNDRSAIRADVYERDVGKDGDHYGDVILPIDTASVRTICEQRQ
jgi:hypothetical protein